MRQESCFCLWPLTNLNDILRMGTFIRSVCRIEYWTMGDASSEQLSYSMNHPAQTFYSKLHTAFVIWHGVWRARSWCVGGRRWRLSMTLHKQIETDTTLLVPIPTNGTQMNMVLSTKPDMWSHHPWSPPGTTLRKLITWNTVSIHPFVPVKKCTCETISMASTSKGTAKTLTSNLRSYER